MSGGEIIWASTGEIIGHNSVMNSQTPSESSAAVAGERKITENSIATASHTPA